MTTSGHHPRVLLTKLGLDGHDRGVRMLARELRDRGCEVVLIGMGTKPSAIAAVARDEDVDVVAVSILSGAHLSLVPMLLDALREGGVHTPVVCGGTIGAADAEQLREHGVRAIAPVGTSVSAAVDVIVQHADPSRTHIAQP